MDGGIGGKLTDKGVKSSKNDLSNSVIGPMGCDG